ncbi:uncharacterized protein TNCT_147511 [Trichonephila clavata]|uniref:Uncharacterized protein n=1 Tax=Trichonephila clavata TaxID=2740835 RepID=A0A8X6L5D1_TRICU|nr:uncharacterized protein TNCT_147511 [Trichonephila clavata]
MSKRMAVVPEELATSYFSKTPDAGLHDIESKIENLLHASSYSDDAKAKLLSQLILKYRITKLARPIILTGAWEVGLSEIFVPRTWFNIGNHNNKYSITYEETKIIEKDYAEYDIGVKIEQGTADADVIEEINQSIEEKCGHFVAFSLDRKNINVHIAPNYELHLTAANAPRLLTMLNLPREDRIIRMSESFVFRKPSKTNKDNHLKLLQEI